VNGNNISGVAGVNTTFQDPNGLNGFNINGVPVRTILLNVAVQDFFDPALLSRAQAVNNTEENFQLVGIDADPNRTGRAQFGINYFRVSSQQSAGLNTGNQRRAMVIDGTTGELLANLQPGLNAATENQTLIDAINSVGGAAPIEDYAFWAEAEISDASLRAEDADADSDGLSNLFEYAYGTDPEVADSEQGPRIVRADGAVTLQYQRSTTAQVAPLSLLGGASLENLTPFDASGLETVGAAIDEVEQISVDLPASLGSRFFLRLTTSTL